MIDQTKCWAQEQIQTGTGFGYSTKWWKEMCYSDQTSWLVIWEKNKAGSLPWTSNWNKDLNVLKITKHWKLFDECFYDFLREGAFKLTRGSSLRVVLVWQICLLLLQELGAIGPLPAQASWLWGGVCGGNTPWLADERRKCSRLDLTWDTRTSAATAVGPPT